MNPNCSPLSFERANTGRREPEAIPSIAHGELSPQGFASLAQFITSELGIKMPPSKMTMVESRLMRRVRELGLDSVEHYRRYFFESPHAAEREHFINAITTNKTSFFREPQHFAYLAATVLPAFSRAAGGRGNRRFKVWSAGCSSGEEAYTLAMLLSEYGRGRPGFEFAILATDISTKVLDQAQSGVYPVSQIAPLPLDLRLRYLAHSRDQRRQLARVMPDLRRKVSFHRLNFMDADYRVKDVFDAIFFRNVMIYFDRETQQAVVNKLCRNLSPGGFLFIGHSESLAGLEVPLESVTTAVLRKPL